MKIQIAAPVSVHGMGKRTNNEDNLFPPPGRATAQDTLFMVCDGVGGSEKGEIASEIACRAVPDYYRQNRIKVSDETSVHNAVAFAQAEIERYGRDNPGSQGMATTVTFLHLHANGATVAHMGDSRVYHVREGRILWCTKDHSYVNDLVKAGVITEDQARTHPRRNVIMRALQGEQKGAVDVHLITDLAANDYFFLCSDGILESVDEALLTTILTEEISDKDKMLRIHALCEANSNDNFTAYLVPIQSVEILTVELLPAGEPMHKKHTVENKTVKSRSGLNMWAVLIVILISSGWYFWDQKKTVSPKSAKPKTGQHVVKKDSVITLHPVKPGKYVAKSKKDKKTR